MRIAVHQPQYLPWLGYFDKITRSDCFVFLDEVQYKVREFQNRNKIRTNQGWIWLTVPVATKGCGRLKIKDILIDNEIDWSKKHLGSLKAFYSKAPYYKNYIEFFEKLYAQKWTHLIDLNNEIIRYLLKVLKIETELKLESVVGTSTTKTDRIIEICQKLEADIYLSGAGAKAYLEEDKFKQAGIRLEFQDYKHPSYKQCFGDFAPYMSVIDLLFNEGDNSINILKGE